MAMSNKAFHRLWNEWNCNKINDYFLALCEECSVDPEAYYIDTDTMKEIRQRCKKEAVWLQDFEESDLYVDLMPFGGYEGNYKILKLALKEYRNTEHHYNGLVDVLVEKYEKEEY